MSGKLRDDPEKFGGDDGIPEETEREYSPSDEEEIAEPVAIEPEVLEAADVDFFETDLEEPSHGKGLITAEGGRADPLSQYLREIGRHSLLTHEEEEELSTRYHTQGDLEAAYRLVVSNLRLVVKIAYEFRRNISNLLDLIQEGNIGLMRAVEKFDPARGVKLSSYAAWWIRAYMIRYILNNWSLVKIGTTQNQRRLFFNLKKEKEALEAEGFRPEPKLLASRLGVKEQEVIEMSMRLSGSDVSLDAPVDEEGTTSRMDLLPDEAPSSFSELENEELRKVINEKLMGFRETLEARDRIIFDKRLMAEDPETLREIGDRFGVSRERIRQMENDLKKRLKEYLKDMPELSDVVESIER
ncbi:sigma-70 family RNA polymerase sigma factor [bacterium]|nr:MAG: sigma-70 family RNA polymerase sigma factor [bacterium]